MMKYAIKFFLIFMNKIIEIILSPLSFLLIFTFSLAVRLISFGNNKPRLVWGEAPIINNVYWSRAMRQCGFPSETFTDSYCSSINKREEYDLVIQEMFLKTPLLFKYYFAFVYSLFKYDIFFISFNGFFLHNTIFKNLEPHFLKLSGKKIIVIPFGGDAFIYSRVKSTNLMHALNTSLPRSSRKQLNISKRVDMWNQYAHVVIPGVMGPDGLGRWDVLSPSILCLDLGLWKKSKKKNPSDGTKKVVKISHSPNFRGFKGSEFVINAVEVLQKEGLKVELVLLEGVQNEVVRKFLFEDVDIHVEQIIATGHGLSGLEGMASGLPTVSNLEDETYTLPMRRWSYFQECPLVSASPETLVTVLRKLIKRPDLRRELGRAGREYVEKYQSFSSVQFLFKEVIASLNDQNRFCKLNQLYHPLLGKYLADKPKISHPLFNNQILD